MMSLLEQVGERDNAYLSVSPPSPRAPIAEVATRPHAATNPFPAELHSVDLFARVSNDLAIGLYESLGYRVFRTVEAYYGGGPREPDENAFDMRKPLSRDKGADSVRLPPGKKDGREVMVQPHEVYFGSG